MDLLDVARGPAWVFAVAVFTLGTLWRVLGVLRLPRMTDQSPEREGAPSKLNAAVMGIWRGLWPRRTFGAAAMGSTINGYVFHIGLALIFLGYAPHTAFIHRVTGIGWPALPDLVMYLASGFTMVSLLLALWFRLSDPVLGRISNADDLISWPTDAPPTGRGTAHGRAPGSRRRARSSPPCR